MKSVDPNRWLSAQQWELELWKRESRAGFRARLRALAAATGVQRLVSPILGTGDDWNVWWMDHFDGYSFVPDSLDNVLELGCGPFTNVRLILKGRRIDNVWCSDPLAREYLSLRGTWLAEAARRGVVEIDDHTAEEAPFSTDQFDLVIMINVLDHVRDLNLSLRNAIRVTKPGGIFIIGQDLTNEGDIERIGDDIGHPIRMTHEDLDVLIAPTFDPIMRRILNRESGRNPAAHYGTYIFAGRKRA